MRHFVLVPRFTRIDGINVIEGLGANLSKWGEFRRPRPAGAAKFPSFRRRRATSARNQTGQGS